MARREFVDTGIWMNLNSGRIQLTQTFRPYKAAKYIKSDDSFFQVAQVRELTLAVVFIVVPLVADATHWYRFPKLQD